MKTSKIIEETESYIRTVFQQEGSGHDWWHIHRVRQLALSIAAKEGADMFIVEMASLLHDLDDWKLIENNGQKSGKALNWLIALEIDSTISKQIMDVIEEVSFKGAGVETRATSLESKAVQDADRLDAIGAIGIARTFAYGGHKNRLIYDPLTDPVEHQSFEEYRLGNGPTINHFYEKLLLLKDRMNTETARNMAEGRHQFMSLFLDEFFNEWNSIC